MVLAPSASEFWEFLGIDQDLEVQASRNSVDTQKSQKFEVFRIIGLRGWNPAWRGGWRVVRKTLDFWNFLDIYMVLAPSASDFLEF